jgi:cytochrome c553
MSAKLVAAVVLVTTVAFSGSALASGSKEAGQAKAATCVACHGVDGNSVNPEWPSIAGQHEPYIVQQLTNFRNGDRQNLLMSPMAMGLSDQDIADLAAYFSAQTATGGETEPSKLLRGQHVYRSGNIESQTAACTACHSPNGRGNPAAGYPSIQGQHATYAAAQLRAYRSGERSTDPNQMMRDIAAKLSDEDIDAVASYIQGLR